MDPRALLRIPLFYKLALANAAVLVLATLLGDILLLRAAPGLDRAR